MLDLTKPYVVNTGLVPKQVGIIREADGAKGSIRVMGRGGKVNIPDGFKKDGNWLALNGDKINVVEPQEAKAQPAPVVTQDADAKATPAPTVQAEESADSATSEATKGE
jgi:hypothetical protein